MVLYPPFLPVAGITLAPALILIRRNRRADFALLMHEETHADQMRRDGWLRFVWRYLTSRKHRQSYEVQAYRTQIDYGGSLQSAARNLSRLYLLGISEDQAKELLQ